MITNITKQTAQALSADIIAALQGVAAKHGITITAGGGTFGPTEYTCRVVCKVTDVDAVEAKRRADWNRNCPIFGLTPEFYGLEVDVGRGKRVKLIGFTNRMKYPVRGIDLETGKEMVYTDILVKMATLQGVSKKD